MPLTGGANNNNSNIITKKCGEIVVTVKKNTKNIYTFSCCFCDTICLHLKKFTLHLEQEHVGQLEQAPSEANTTDDKTEIQTVPLVDNILLGEIKIEDCTNDYIKSENGEENSRVVTSNKKCELHTKFQDPLETFEDNSNGLFQPFGLEYNETTCNDNEEVEMHNFLDEQHEMQSDSSGEDYGSETDLRKDDSPEGKAAECRAKAQEKEFTLALIIEYQKNPQLWNTTLAAKCNIQQKEDLLQIITDNLNTKLKTELKLQMVKKKLNFICNQYEKEIERQLNEKTINSDLWFYENMSFLKDITENKLKLKKRKPNLKVQNELLTVAKCPNFTKNCWRKLLTDNLAENICWKGTAEKKSARSLSSSKDIRNAAISIGIGDDEYTKSTKSFFQFAKNRQESRKKYISTSKISK